MKQLTTTERSLISAFYLIALQYPKQNETFAICEELIKPCFIAASKEIVDSKAARKHKDVPLSNNTVQRRIVDMAKYVEDQVIEGIKKSVYRFFFKEKVRYPVWTCRDPISLILRTRFEILGTRIGSLKHLKKPRVYFAIQLQSTDGSNLAILLCFVQYKAADFEE